MTNSKKSKSWRDVLPIHPAAELFPLMSESELRELADDLKAHGLRVPIVACKSPDGKHLALIDGRNRLDAMALTGLLHHNEDDGELYFDGEVVRFYAVKTDPYEAALSLNIHRRHLTGEQKRDLIAKVLKAKPEASNRQIAKQTKADDKTVAKVRNELEGRSEIPNVDTRSDTKGRGQPARRSRKKKAAPKTDLSADKSGRATGSAEVSEEQRRADMARLDEPAEEPLDVDRLVQRVITEIRIQLRELSCRRDTERFFAALRGQIDDLVREKLQDAVDADPPADLSIPECLRRVSP